MKELLFGLFLTSSVWAKPLVLLTYFDPFNGASVNNSETIASSLYGSSEQVEIVLCELPTSYEGAFVAWEDCLKKLPKTPDLALSLGEFGKEAKFETVAKNSMQDTIGDNDGVSYPRAESIIRNAPISLRLNSPRFQGMSISSNAGTFVCNNLMYKVTHFYPALKFSFIHVPHHGTFRLAKKNRETIAAIITHFQQIKSLPTIP